MFKNTLKRLGAIVMVLALAMSVMAVTAFADATGNAAYETDFSKIVTTDGYTCAPNTTFTYSVTNGEKGSFTAPGESNAVVVYAGQGGVSLTETAFVPTQKTEASYTVSGKIQVAAGTFTVPGVYHYVVKEDCAANTDNYTNYEGIEYDATARDLYVYVIDNNGTIEVSGIVMVKQGSTSKNEAFTNNYGAGTNDSTHDITVTKKVEGSQGDKTKLFDFKVSVNGANGEMYRVDVKETASATPVTQYVTSGAEAVTISIKDGGSIQIFGLTENDTYTINEESYTSDGYTTTNQDNTGKLTEDGTAITVTNTKDVSTPTGVIMNIAPYVLMVALAGGIAFFFLRRRHAE